MSPSISSEEKQGLERVAQTRAEQTIGPGKRLRQSRH